MKKSPPPPPPVLSYFPGVKCWLCTQVLFALSVLLLDHYTRAAVDLRLHIFALKWETLCQQLAVVKSGFFLKSFKGNKTHGSAVWMMRWFIYCRTVQGGWGEPSMAGGEMLPVRVKMCMITKRGLGAEQETTSYQHPELRIKAGRFTEAARKQRQRWVKQCISDRETEHLPSVLSLLSEHLLSGAPLVSVTPAGRAHNTE